MAKKLKTSTKGYKKSSPDKNEPALRIPSGRITMKDVPFPVLGIDNYGNSVIMQPGEEYQFPGSEVIEMPVLQTGGRAPIYTSNPNDPRLRAYNDSGESLIPEGFNSPYKGDLKSFSPKVDVKKKEGQSKKIEQQKKVEKIISKQKTIGPTKQFISHHLEKKHEEDRLKKLEEYAATHPEVEVSPYGNLTTSSYGEFIQKYGKNLDKFAGSMETPLAIQGAGDLLYGVGKLGAKYLPQVGEYLTTQTPLKNTYKYNPWAFKPNPEAYYRRIGGDEGLDDLLTSGEVRASQIHHTKNLQGINLAKAHTEPYFSIGVPFDTRYGPKNQFYKGPYTLELKNHPMTGKVNGKLSRKANIGVPLEPVYLDNPNLKIYKEDWLKGYKEVPKPKSTFKSEIDWSKWNPEQGTATGYMKKGGLTPNKAREILHDGKVHGKKLTEKQRRFFGAMSKGHTKNYEHGGEMKKGGIHIDPKNKGKFTKSAKAAGMGVQEFARHVLANKEDYSPTQVKRANFARNAKKWSAQEGFVVPSGETWQFDPITGEPMGAPEKWRNEDDPVTIPGLKEHLAKIKAGVPTNPFKTTGNEGSVQNPMGAGEPDNGPEKKPSKNYLPTLNAINFGLTKLAESLRNKELERYNRQMIALQNVPQPRRLTRIEQYGDPSVYQIGGMIPEDVSYLMGTIPNFDMLPTPAKSSSGMDNVVQGAIKGTTQQAKGTPVPGSDYENVIYNTYIENGLTPQAALFLTAQTMHETANYSSNVFKKNNNVGGIKIPKTRKSPYIEGVGTSAPANESKNQKMNKYAKYKDVKSGAMDLLEWMKYNKIDPNKFNTPEEYAIALYNKSYYHEVTGVKGAETKEAAINTYSSSLKRKIEKLKKKGFEKGGEYDLSDSEIAELKAQGYDIEIID